MTLACYHLLFMLQLMVPAIGVQRYANVNEKFDDTSSVYFDDRASGQLDDQSNGSRGIASRFTANDTAEGIALSAKLEAMSRVTYYGMVEWTALGTMNRVGVTKYKHNAISKKTRSDGKFFWPDSVNREGAQLYSGAKDLTESVSWGWHHPSNLYGTIPVGGPLIDDSMNIYLGSDDAIRKFDVSGNLTWSYAPRGQLAAAPTLSTGCAPAGRMGASVMDDITEEEENMLRPDWAQGAGSGIRQRFKDFKVGDLVKVKAGSSYRADGRELYSAGDQGLISSVVADEDGKYDKAIILWTGTGRKSAVQFDAINNHFLRVEPATVSACTPLLIGSTTNGYVFAIDLVNGLEQWAIQGTATIAGVKGSLASKDGIVVVATNRCTDRYCYRYRNQTNVLTPGNTVVRGLNVVTGAEVWNYVPQSPVWNMNPVWGPDGNVFFNDQEGRLYSLSLTTGTETWAPAGGELGTYTEAAAVYDSGHNVVVALGMLPYTGSGCNPYTAPGILPLCGNAPFKQGFIRAYNATSGRQRWSRTTPHPPASATSGMLNSPTNHTRLVVTMGFNCFRNSPSRIWGMDAHTGGVRWNKEGPTLWSSMCAGDKEGGDIRRAVGGRATCSPGSWSAPVIDRDGDVYVGNQVGVFERWGSLTQRNQDVEAQSSLTTGVAFQDSSTALADGLMAVVTCTSLIVFQTTDLSDTFQTGQNWTFPPHGYSTDGEQQSYS